MIHHLRSVPPNDPASNDARRNLQAGIERIFSSVSRGRGWESYPFNTLTIGSCFQPILCVKTSTCFGYEGLLLAANIAGRQVDAETVFAVSADTDEHLFLDWLCRALHLRNVANLGSSAAERGMLFLNVYPNAAVEDPHHPTVFQRMLEQYGVAPGDVVVEILEAGVSDELHLADAAALYRKLGCKIAIDDFGIGYSNVDRLWRIRPDFVKIDRSVVKSARAETHARLVLANMIRLINSCGAKVVIEGIEQHSEAVLAIELGADYLQGYYFARPSQLAFPTDLARKIVDGLRQEVDHFPRGLNPVLANHGAALKSAADQLSAGIRLEQAVERLLALPHSVRAYLVRQSAIEHEPSARLAVDDFSIEVSEGEDWLHVPTPTSTLWRVRNIIERSVACPRHVQVSDPSMHGEHEPVATVTLSYALDTSPNSDVLCVDVHSTDTIVDRRSMPVLSII